MAVRRESWREHIADSLRFATRGYWKVALLVAGLAAILIAYSLWVYRDASEPTVEEEGQVVRFGSSSDSGGNRPTVLVRLRDGSIRQLTISVPSLRACRTGGRIRLLRGTGSLRVSPRGCAPATP